MKMRTLRTGLAVSLVMLAFVGYWGYNRSQSAADNTRTAALMETDRSFVTGYNQFAGRLYQETVKQSKPGENQLLSPYSVAAVLSMAYNGAGGQTGEEIARVLGYPETDKERVSEANDALRKATVQSKGSAKLLIANSQWVNRGYAFDSAYAEAARAFYDAQLQTLDFSRQTAVQTINKWVSKKTFGKIPKLLSEIEKNTASILINTVYFNSPWATPFNPAYTKEQPFFQEDGSTVQVQMMNQGGSFLYAKTDEVEAVQLPYEGGQLAMNLYLPGEKTGNVVKLAAWLYEEDGTGKTGGSLELRTGTVAMPSFKLERDMRLEGILKNLGLQAGFDPQKADFKPMFRQSPANGYMSQVLQKSYIEVTEQGTEAAAATAVTIAGTSARITPQEPFQWTADRPFLFTITDNRSGLILFMGCVRTP